MVSNCLIDAQPFELFLFRSSSLGGLHHWQRMCQPSVLSAGFRSTLKQLGLKPEGLAYPVPGPIGLCSN